MSKQYHGRRIFENQYQHESPMDRAEREEQHFRHRHDRLHRMQQLRTPERHADARTRGIHADVWDDDLDDLVDSAAGDGGDDAS